MAVRVIGVRQMRDELASVMDQLQGLGQVVITSRGEGKAVLMDLDRYNQLIERLEYLEDTLDAIEGQRAGAVTLADIG